jgi:hypothetical protein
MGHLMGTEARVVQISPGLGPAEPALMHHHQAGYGESGRGEVRREHDVISRVGTWHAKVVLVPADGPPCIVDELGERGRCRCARQ